MSEHQGSKAQGIRTQQIGIKMDSIEMKVNRIENENENRNMMEGDISQEENRYK